MTSRPKSPPWRRAGWFAGLVALACIAWAGWLLLVPATPPGGIQEFELRDGLPLRAAARELEAKGIVRSALALELLGRTLGVAGRIRAGIYEFGAPLNAWHVLRHVTEGDPAQSVITIPEGWTLRQVRQALAEHPALRHDTRDLDEATLAIRIGLDHPSAEGWIFPETYHFASGSSELALLQRARRLMAWHLDRMWAARAPGLPLEASYDALKLASIVEKETGTPAERPLIAGVFANRLRRGMMLQTDPTVIYGLGPAFDGDLRKRDLLADQSYNTYTRTGLPPTPIANPGLDSLRAATQPAATAALYFVARGDGTSHFSDNLADHNRAVARYQKKR